MKIKFNWKKAGIITGSLLVGLYVLFLALPLILSPIANSYCTQIEELIKVSTGLDAHIEGIRITTSPKLAVGVKVNEFLLFAPNNKTPIIDLDDASADLRLLPLILKQIRFGNITAEDVDVNIVLKKDGQPEILDYLPQQNEQDTQKLTSLPYGFKLSNHLPNIKLDEYQLTFIDKPTKKTYYIDGNDIKITDFILHKKMKIITDGQIVFDKRIISDYDIKIFNKIMPDIRLDDLIFPKEVKIEPEQTRINDFKINIIDLFETVNKNGLKGDIKCDIKTSGTFKNPVQKGTFELSELSVISNGKQLPDSYAKLIFKGKSTDIDSVFYTSDDIEEKTHVLGNIRSGENPYIKLSLRSNAKLNNIIRLIDSTAQSFGKNELKTITATGAIDADFSVNSDLKTINSTGYFKIPNSTLRYGLYNVSVNNINADINFDNNNIEINNIGFSIMGHPLKIIGKITSDAIADIKIMAERLSLKGLALASGQVSLLKENDFNSGTLSFNAVIKGALSEIKPDVTLSADNINIYSKTAKARVLLNKAIVKLLLSKDNLNGDIDINSLKLKNDMASVSIPKSLISMDKKDINIKNSSVLINNSRIGVTGSVKDYSNENLNMNIQAKGNLASSDVIAFVPKELKWMFSGTGAMPLSITAKGNDKVQHVTFDLSATPNGYVRILDVNKLKGTNTKIHTDAKIENNSVTLVNSGIFANSQRIATFDGGVKNLSNPNLNINISVPQNISFPIPGMGEHSNITADGAVNLAGNPMNPKLKGRVNMSDLSVKEMNFALTNMVLNLNGEGISGDGTAKKMKFDGIIGTNIGAKFALNNFTDFNLNDIKADVFGGKVTGKLTYHIPTFAFGIDLTGKGLNSNDAVYGAVGISKALTGLMNFNAKLTSKGVTDTAIIKNMKGDIDFLFENGRFISIGKLENLVAAQNITTNSILKSAVSALTTAANIQETNKFKNITGKLTMSNGSAGIDYIYVSGPLMSYYVKGGYDILGNSANLVILGRIDSKVVSYLGPIGQLSAEKLLSYIPKFGTATAQFLKLLTQDPKNEPTNLIPALTSGSENYKDFKVIYSGVLERASSMRSFRWLSNCDTTKMDLKQEAQNAVKAAKDNVKGQVQAVKTSVQNTKSNINKIVETQKQQIQTEKKAIEQAKADVQNIKQNASQSAANLGKLLKNAASNANKKIETAPKTEQTNTQTTTTNTAATSQPETKTETTQPSSDTAQD